MRGYGPEAFSPAARAAKIRVDFQRAALQCGRIAQHIDGDLPEQQLAEMRQLALYLVAELEAMRSRTTKGMHQ